MSRTFIVAGASSHSGKTLVTLGLIAAFRARSLTVAAAKCGPDYIDPRFLEAASGKPAINLDPWAMAPDTLAARAARQAEGADVFILEGVMGLYDGGPGGAGSTASLAAALGLPVVLVVAASGLAQSAAAIAEGFSRLANGFTVAGAIVNQIASDRHEALIREGFARASVPLLGTVRRDPSIAIASRHLGLIQAEEHADLAKKIARAGERITQDCDLEAILKLAGASPPPRGKGLGEGQRDLTDPGASPPPCGEGLGVGSSNAKRQPGIHPGAVAAVAAAAHSHSPRYPTPNPSPQGGGGLTPLGNRIAVARDVAFAFAYPHMLDDWREAGADIRFFSPLADEPPPSDADAIFVPGGYPELHAGRIAAAENFRVGMQAARARGALIYGECGGYMVLGDALIDGDNVSHRMLGFLPLVTSFATPKLHLGYRRLTPLGGLPWDVPLAAHEFHFATIVSSGEGEALFEAASADGQSLGPIGHVISSGSVPMISQDVARIMPQDRPRMTAGIESGRVMGSFAHVIGRLPEREG